MAGGGGLFGANVTESMQDFVIHGIGIVEQGANDALDSLDAFVGQRRAGVFVWGELCFGAIDDWGSLEGGYLTFLGRDG